MSLHDLLDDLATDAPTHGAPAADLWRRGRHHARVRRVGTVAVVAAACLGLVALTGVGWQTRTASVPASTSDRAPAMPDRLYAPNGWLPSFKGAPGVLAAVMPACQNSLFGSKPGVVGVSATTGRYGFLTLPHASLWASAGVLAPDGRSLAFWTEGAPVGKPHDFGKDHLSSGPASLRCFARRTTVNGFAVYDATTGRTTFTKLSSPHGVAPQQLVWADDQAVYATYGHELLGKTVSAGRWVSVQGMPDPSAAVRADLSGTANVAPAGHGRVLVDRTSYDKNAHPLHYKTTHELVDLATGTRRSFTSEWDTDADSATSPGVAAVSPDGDRSAYTAGSASTIEVARIDGSVPRNGAPVSLRRVAPSAAPAGQPGGVWIAQVDGWIDEDHLAVTVEQPGRSSPTVKNLQVARMADLSVTGVTNAVSGLEDVPELTRLVIAYELLANPTFHAHKPPSPLGPRRELGIGVGVMVVALAAVVVWRRRARV